MGMSKALKNKISYDRGASLSETPEEIKAALDKFKLIGRKIRRLKAIGLDYSHRCDNIEEEAYNIFEDLPEDERAGKSDYFTMDPDVEFLRFMEIDEPLLIEFEDGDVFEIEARLWGVYRISMNEIPWDAEPVICPKNLDANVMLAPCVGKKICEVDVNIDETAVDCTGFEQGAVKDITLRFEDGVNLKLYDRDGYFLAECMDNQGEYLKIKFSELKPGLFNREDIQYDPVTDFFTFNSSFHFGEKGKQTINGEYMTLYSSGNEKSRLYIPIDDFIIPDWCISLFEKDYFDIYGCYDFTYDEWHGLLDEGDRLLAIDNFDTLFDELIKLQGDNEFMLRKLNRKGAVFWQDRQEYIGQLRALREWTDLVLKPGDTMHVSGF